MGGEVDVTVCRAGVRAAPSTVPHCLTSPSGIAVPRFDSGATSGFDDCRTSTESSNCGSNVGR